jgi:hypothetical protein
MHIPFRAYLIPLAAVLILLTVGVRARADDCPPKDNACWIVRMAVAKHGERVLVAKARSCGWNYAEIDRAKRCLR